MADNYPESWPDGWPHEAITLIEVAEEERDELRIETAKLRLLNHSKLNDLAVLRSTNTELRAQNERYRAMIAEARKTFDDMIEMAERAE